jgi:hypothetical protein
MAQVATNSDVFAADADVMSIVTLVHFFILGRHEWILDRQAISVLATEDHYVGTEETRRPAAERAGARIEMLDGLGHWWMVQDSARGADVLTRF